MDVNNNRQPSRVTPLHATLFTYQSHSTFKHSCFFQAFLRVFFNLFYLSRTDFNLFW
jgi:hypothetical protein